MFFIVNHENSIIAADTIFLDTIGANDIFAAAALISAGEVKVNEYEQVLLYSDTSMEYRKVPLITFFGEAYLYQFEKLQDNGAEEGSKETSLEIDKSFDTDNEPPEIDEEISSLDDDYEKDISEMDHDEILKLIAKDNPEYDTEADLSIIDEINTPSENDENGILELIPKDINENENEISTIGLVAEKAEEIRDNILSFDDAPIKEEDLSISNEINAPSEDDKNEILELMPDEVITEIAEKDIKENENEISTVSDEETIGLDTIALAAEKDIDNIEEPGASNELFSLKEVPEILADDNLEPIIENEIDYISDEKIISNDTKGLDLPENTKEGLTDSKPLNINPQELAKLIGVSENEYIGFIDDFLNESEKLKPELKGADLKASREAAAILKEAAILLHIPHLSEKLTELDNATSDEKGAIIDEYFKLSIYTSSENTSTNDALLNLSKNEEITNETSNENIDGISQVQDSTEEYIENSTFDIIEDTTEVISQVQDSTEDSIEAPTVKISDGDANAAPQVNINNIDLIDLDTIQAIPFDFSLKEASEELTLPESLVGEFVIDFINQAKENLPVLQIAHRDGDIDQIQKLAHMLKGASSNLRVVPMADTLSNLQLNTYLERVPELIEVFAGQLKSLDHQMNA